jgi:hypothetical protein
LVFTNVPNGMMRLRGAFLTAGNATYLVIDLTS